MSYNRKPIYERRCYGQAPIKEGSHRGFNELGSGVSLKLKARLLVVAVLSVAIALATPALAFEPKMPELAFFVKTPAMAKDYAKRQLKKYGWQNQWGCLLKLWQQESNWRPNAKNKQPVYQQRNGHWVKLYAGGIPQVLHLNPKVDIPTQVTIGLKYIQERYSSPCKALQFHNNHYYY